MHPKPVAHIRHVKLWQFNFSEFQMVSEKVRDTYLFQSLGTLCSLHFEIRKPACRVAFYEHPENSLGHSLAPCQFLFEFEK